MVTGFLDAITKVRQFRFHNDDDFIDRLSRRYSVVLFILFTVIVSTKQYVGDRKFDKAFHSFYNCSVTLKSKNKFEPGMISVLYFVK
jgi:hypothetical protein